MLSLLYKIDSPWLNPIIHRPEFLGIDHINALKMYECILRHQISTLAQIFNESVNENGVEQATGQLHMSTEMTPLEYQYSSQAMIMKILQVPEFGSVEIPLSSFFESFRNELTSEKEIQDLARQLGTSYLDDQLSREDTHLLDSCLSSIDYLDDRWSRVEEIRSKETEKISIELADMLSSRFGMYDFRSAYRSALGFESLVNSRVGPWAYSDSAEKGIKILQNIGLLGSDMTLPDEPPDEEDESLAIADDYSLLFEGFSDPKKVILNAIMQSLDPDVQISIKGYQVTNTMSHKIWHEPLIAGCKSDDIRILQPVLKGIGIQGDASFISHIEPLLSHDSKEIRAAVLNALGEIRSEESIDIILQYGLQTKEWGESQDCINILSYFENEQAADGIKQLIRLANDVSKPTLVARLAGTKQWSAFPLALESFFNDEITKQMLGIKPEKTGSSKSSRVVTSMMQDGIKLIAPRQIARFGDLAIDPLIHMISVITGAKISGMQQRSNELTQHVEDRIKAQGLTAKTHTIVEPLQLAISALGSIPSKRSVQALVDMVSKVDEKTRGYVLVALTKQGLQAYSQLMTLLESENQPTVSKNEALAYFNLKEANEFLITGLKDENERIRNSAAISLAYRRDSESIKALGKIIQQLPQGVQVQISEKLGLSPCPESDALKKRIDEEIIPSLKK